MNRLRPYLPGDARLVPLQARQAGEFMDGYDNAKGPAMTLERSMAMIGGECYRVVACAGLAEVWPGRFQAWGLFGKLRPREWVLARRACRQVLEATPGRIEATAAFEPAEAFLISLGFEKEGVMRAYWKGRDHALFARVNA